jgi:hypothetical protein
MAFPLIGLQWPCGVGRTLISLMLGAALTASCTQRRVAVSAAETASDLGTAAESRLKPATIVAARIPPRPKDAVGGREFLRRTAQLSLADREQRIADEVLRGNIPSFLRSFVPVAVDIRNEYQILKRGWIFVLTDYLAIGSDVDFVRIPMTPVTAQRIADKFGAMLPTSSIVNSIYAAADLKLAPKPMKPGWFMRSNDYFFKHEDLIEPYVPSTRHGQLIAGHKKDVVITRRQRPGRVAIYGWHLNHGEPIQPLSVWHHLSYTDYSHGVRLVHPHILVDGEMRPMTEVLMHPFLSQMVSFEGAFWPARITDHAVEWSAVEMRAPYNGHPPARRRPPLNVGH